jgi:hypothetical protein
VLALVGLPGDHHGDVADTGCPQQGVLGLADLDPEATDLDLGIPATEELQLAVRKPAAPVAAAVEPLTLTVRIGHEGQPRAVGIVDVTAADADPGEHDLSRGAERHRCEVLVDDVDVYVVDGGTERDPLAVRDPVHDLVVGVVGGLGQSVRVNQLDLGFDREPAPGELHRQRLPRSRHAPQVRKLAGVLLQIGHDHFEVRRYDLEDGDVAVDERVDEPRNVQDHFLLDQQGPPTDKECRDQLPQRDVKALGCGLGDHLPLADLQVVDLGVEVIE